MYKEPAYGLEIEREILLLFKVVKIALQQSVGLEEILIDECSVCFV